MATCVSSLYTRENFGGGAAWLDVESEPAIFQDILHKLGAEGVRVQELYGLDDECFCMLEGRVLGLVFLFNFRQVDGEEEDDQSCPEHVWFANQTTNNSCATVAMLNILLNIPGIKYDAGGLNVLGDLKTATSSLIPAERGHYLSVNAAIRRIHNASAREMDAMNASLSVQNEYDEWLKSRKSRKKSGTFRRNRASGGKTKKPKQDNDNAFHYIAYVPIGDEVWRLDGLLKQPRSLGKFQGDWTAFARHNIMQRIEAEGDLDYNLMALCANNEQTLLLQALQNAKSIETVKQSLLHTEEWAKYCQSNDLKPMQSPEFLGTFGITDSQLVIENVVDPADSLPKMMGAEHHIDIMKSLVKEQDELKKAYVTHMIHKAGAVEASSNAKDDFTDATYEIIKTLVDAGFIPANSRR